MKLVSVVLDIPTQALDSTFTYAVVENENDRIRLSEAALKANQSTNIQTAHRQSSKSPKPLQASLDELFGEPGGSASLDSFDKAVTDEAVASEDAFVLEIGCAVLVPFGNRNAVGFVVDIKELSPSDPFPDQVNPAKLKEIDSVISKPYFTKIGAECASFLAAAATLRRFLQVFVYLCLQAAFRK